MSGNRLARIATFLTLLAFASTLSWTKRNYINADGLRYLDVATETLKSSPGALVQRYWAPLYPAVIAASLAIVLPAIKYELPLVHALNVLIFLAAGAAFLFFLKSRARPVPIFFAGVVFGWSSLVTGIQYLTPDMCLACVIFSAAALACRLSAASTTRTWLLLGAILGIGGYAKSAGIPIGALLLAILLAFPPDQRRVRFGPIAAAIAFAIVLTPAILALSIKDHRLSMGGAGQMNYVFNVNRVDQFAVWSGQPFNNSRAIHPARVLLQHPLTLEFDGPIPGTYPLWYDPSYWSEGIQPRVNTADQLRMLHTTLGVFFHGLVAWGWLTATAIWLFIAAKTRRLPPHLWMFLWPTGVLVMYLFVYLEDRYLGPFAAILALGAVWQLANPRATYIAIALLTAVIAIPIVLRFTHHETSSGITNVGPANQLQVAAELLRLGIHKDDRVATCGDSFVSYWARAASVKIVAQIVECDSSHGFTAANLPEILSPLKALHIKALISNNVPNDAAGLPWQTLGDTWIGRYSAYILPP